MFSLLFALAMSPTASASKICVVDFQRAVTETEQGKAAQKKIDTMYATRQGEIQRMESEFEKAVKDYQSRAMILADAARADEEQRLALQQRNLQETVAQYQQEMQQTYMTMLGDLDEKMRAVASEVGRAQTCSLVLDQAMVVFTSDEVADVTAQLVAQYNAVHKP